MQAHPRWVHLWQLALTACKAWPSRAPNALRRCRQVKVYHHSPDGVVTVKFRAPEAAQSCIRLMSGALLRRAAPGGGAVGRRDRVLRAPRRLRPRRSRPPGWRRLRGSWRRAGRPSKPCLRSRLSARCEFWRLLEVSCGAAQPGCVKARRNAVEAGPAS